MFDYLMVRKSDVCLVKDVHVNLSEDCVPQHRIVIGRLIKKIVKFVSTPRMWKLKDEESARLMKLH